MITYSVGSCTVDMSDDIFRMYMRRFFGRRKALKHLKQEEMEGFYRASDILWGKGFKAPESSRRLIAHGNSFEDYIFVDRIRKRRLFGMQPRKFRDRPGRSMVRQNVDEWIRKHQASVDLLVITVCNTHGAFISPRYHAGVIYPSGFVRAEEIKSADDLREHRLGHIEGMYSNLEIMYYAPCNFLRFAPPAEEYARHVGNAELSFPYV